MAIVLDITIFITNMQFYGIKTILKLKWVFFPGTFFLWTGLRTELPFKTRFFKRNAFLLPTISPNPLKFDLCANKDVFQIQQKPESLLICTPRTSKSDLNRAQFAQ